MGHERVESTEKPNVTGDRSKISSGGYLDWLGERIPHSDTIA